MVTRRFAMLGMLATATSASAQPATSPRPGNGQSFSRRLATPPEKIHDERVEHFLLKGSRHEGEPWQIHVAWPAASAPADGYRTLYLLDGNATFPMAWHHLKALEKQTAHRSAAQTTILIGIGYPDDVMFDVRRRYFDLTSPTAPEYEATRPGVKPGGNEFFLDFIEFDLLPALYKRARINRQRQSLYGHSLAGYCALHAFFTRCHLFNNWIMADPSLWWDAGSIIYQHDAFLSGVRAAGNQLRHQKRLLIERSMGKKPRPPGSPNVKPDNPQRRHIIESIHPELLARLDLLTLGSELATISNVEVGYHQYSHETHGSMINPSVGDAVLFSLDTIPDHVQKLSNKR